MSFIFHYGRRCDYVHLEANANTFINYALTFIAIVKDVSYSEDAKHEFKELTSLLDLLHIHRRSIFFFIFENIFLPNTSFS